MRNMPKKISFKKSKKKIREIKSSKKIKEISERRDDGEELEEESGQLNDSDNIKISEIKSSPVLEKVASDEGVLWRRNADVSREEREDDGIKYKEDDSDYLTAEETRPRRERMDNGYIESTPDYLSITDPNKEIKDMKKIMEHTGERITKRHSEHSWNPIEKRGQTEQDDKTKKYIGKGERY